MGIDDARVLILGLSFVVAGCGGDTIVVGGAGGSAGSGGAGGSGGAAVLSCDPTQPFANIARVPGVPDTSYDARPSDDGLSLLLDVFSTTANDTVMHRATRPAITDPFGTPAMVNIMGGVQRRTNGIVTFDGQTLLFQGFEAAGPIQIYAVSASVLEGGSELPTLLSLNGGAPNEAPYPSGDGSRIYFATSRAAGPYEIWTAVQQGSDYVSPEPLASINVATEDRFAPVVSRDGLTIYFASRVAGNVQIHVSIRRSADDPFGAGAPVPSLASSALFNIPTWLSADGCTLYFNSNRDGMFAIYSASLPPP
jgi:WD40 repeat protein